MKDGVYKVSPNLTVHMHYENILFQNAGIIALAVNPGGGLWLTNGKIVYLLKNNEFYTLNYPVENFPFNQVYQLKNSDLILGKKGFFAYAFEGISMDKITKIITYKSVTKTLTQDTKITINKGENKVNTFGNLTVHLYKFYIQFQHIKDINLGEHVYNTFYNINDDLIINARKNYIYRNEKLMPCKELSRFDTKIIMDHLILNDSIELFNIEGDSIYLYDQHTFINLTAAFGSPIDLQIRKATYEKPTLYLSTFRNIYKCDNPSDIFRNKPVKLKLVNINFRNIHDIVVKNDSVYIASDDGLTIIPEPLNREIKTFTPIPYIQSILVNDIEADLSEQNITLTGNNRIKVIFSSINYSSTPVMYSYMLEGADCNWSKGRGRIVIYENLPAGNYIFKLRTRKPNSEWSRPVEFKILIKSHFWMRPLFLTGMSVLFLILIFLAILRRKNIQIKHREIDHQLITLEQKALQSMMNPHFIFNSLGSIQNYLLQNKSKEAGLYLSQFARLIRQNLNAINAANINLDEEIDRLKNYLDLEKMRMENKFDYTIEVDENLDADEILIPSMIIQPFVENAIWHGIAGLDYRGSIHIIFRQHTEKSLLILVEDNGVGMKRSVEYSIKSEKHVNLGMEMNRRRLDLIGKKYHIDTCIKISEANPGNPNPGTKVELVVPVVV